MSAFINEVAAQTGYPAPGKVLTSDQAMQLTSAANQIKAALGCS